MADTNPSNHPDVRLAVSLFLDGFNRHYILTRMAAERERMRVFWGSFYADLSYREAFGLPRRMRVFNIPE